MRYSIAASAILTIAVIMALLARQRPAPAPNQAETADPSLASVFHTSDPRVAGQLLEGFHEAEAGGRWTKSRFAVALGVPHLAPGAQPELVVKLFIPESEMAKLKSMTLTATVGGAALPPETFTSGGLHTYLRKLPLAAVRGDRVRADFALDKWQPAGTVDDRELAIVVAAIGLTEGGF